MGITRTAETETGLSEKELMEAVDQARASTTRELRDEMHHILIINGKEEIPLDITKLKGNIKKLVETELIKKLKR